MRLGVRFLPGALLVDVAQLVERLVVVQVVAGSIPVIHPLEPRPKLDEALACHARESGFESRRFRHLGGVSSVVRALVMETRGQNLSRYLTRTVFGLRLRG